MMQLEWTPYCAHGYFAKTPFGDYRVYMTPAEGYWAWQMLPEFPNGRVIIDQSDDEAPLRSAEDAMDAAQINFTTKLLDCLTGEDT